MALLSDDLRAALNVLKEGADGGALEVCLVVFTATDYCHASRALADLLGDGMVPHVRFDVPLLVLDSDDVTTRPRNSDIGSGGSGSSGCVDVAAARLVVRSAAMSQEAMRHFKVDTVPAVVFVRHDDPTLAAVGPSAVPATLQEATAALVAAAQLPPAGEPPLPSLGPAADVTAATDAGADGAAAVTYTGPGAGWAKAAHAAYNEAGDLAAAAAHFSAAALAADAAAAGDDADAATAAAKDAR
jgi:hypothetical protein